MKTIQQLLTLTAIAMFTSCSYHGASNQQVRVTTKIESPQGSHALPSMMMRNVESGTIVMGDNAGAVSGVSATYKTSEVSGGVNLSGHIEIDKNKHSIGVIPVDAKPKVIAIDDKTRVIIMGTRVDATGTPINVSEQGGADDR